LVRKHRPPPRLVAMIPVPYFHRQAVEIAEGGDRRLFVSGVIDQNIKAAEGLG